MHSYWSYWCLEVMPGIDQGIINAVMTQPIKHLATRLRLSLKPSRGAELMVLKRNPQILQNLSVNVANFLLYVATGVY